MNKPSHKPAFTLVELLVVVAIIIVLIAMLVPGLDQAMKATRIAVCMTNTRAWSQGMAQYALAHKGAVVYLGNGSRGQYWYDRLSGYVGEPHYDKIPNQNAGMLKANYCPETNHAIPPNGFGTARITWNSSTAQGSYGWNLWIASRQGYYDQDTQFPVQDYYAKYSRAPGDVPIMGDSNWIGSWPDDVDLAVPPESQETGYTNHQVGFFMGRFSVARHELSINVSLVDGSAHKSMLWDLWALPWNRGFMRGARDPSEFK